MVKIGTSPIKIWFRRWEFCRCFLEMCQIFTVFQLVSKNNFEKKGRNIWMGKKYDYLCSRLKSQIQ